jgi:hypothetical protein
MTVARLNIAWFAIMGFLAIMSWITTLPEEPRIYAPLNLMVVMPAFLIANLIECDYMYVAVAVVPFLFCLWCYPILLRRNPMLPTRSIILAVMTLFLSALTLVFGARYGVQYQSRTYVVGVVVINIVCWILLGVLAYIARRRPSLGRNLAFHAALFAWLAWCAFPYLGELP